VPSIAHVAQIELGADTGMGRVALAWREEFEQRGWQFIHVGSDRLPGLHPARFPIAAFSHCRRLRPRPDGFLVHEPAGAPFLVERRRLVVFSHGLERRAWQSLRRSRLNGSQPALKSRLLFPLWRLLPADLALGGARAVLALNSEDAETLRTRYRRRPEDVFLFRNGVQTVVSPSHDASSPPTVLFIGSWLERKGVSTLTGAAETVATRLPDVRFLVAGTGAGRERVLADWPSAVRDRVEVVPRFEPEDELHLYSRGDVFVLPSVYEGQPLALLQAMAAGLCCVAADTAGIRDLIQHELNGLLHPVGDAGALAQCIVRTLGDRNLRAQLAANARLSVAGRSWPEVSQEVIDFVLAAIA